jgi:predicted permease
VGAVSELPLSGEVNSGTFAVEARAVPASETQPHSEIWSATPGYFRALGIPLESGRLFDRRDEASRVPVAIVSERLVRAYFPGEDPVGKRVAFEGTPDAPRWRTIVGVVGDVRDQRLDRPPGPQMYVPYAQRPERRLFLAVRTAVDPLAWHEALRAAVHEVDPDLPLQEVTTMERLVRRDTSARRAARWALGGFAAAALALTALGLYALLAQAARERVPEVGVRIALGAGRSDVMRLFLGEGARLVAWGLLAGVPLAVASTRLLRAFVFGVSHTDPLTFGTVGLILGAAAVLASGLPAWRASGVDPASTLRSE